MELALKQKEKEEALELALKQKEDMKRNEETMKEKEEANNQKDEVRSDSVPYSSEEISNFNQWFVRGLECLENKDEQGLINFLQNNEDSVPMVQELAETYSRIVGKPYQNIDNEKGKVFEKLRSRFKFKVNNPGPNITYSKTEMEATVLGSNLESFREELHELLNKSNENRFFLHRARNETFMKGAKHTPLRKLSCST